MTDLVRELISALEPFARIGGFMCHTPGDRSADIFYNAVEADGLNSRGSARLRVADFRRSREVLTRAKSTLSDDALQSVWENSAYDAADKARNRALTEDPNDQMGALAAAIDAALAATRPDDGWRDIARTELREIIAAEIKIGEPYGVADRIIASLIRNGIEL